MIKIDHEDAQYLAAVGLVIVRQRCSTSYIGRELGIAYGAADALVKRMERDGIVATPNHVGKRAVLAEIEKEPRND